MISCQTFKLMDRVCHVFITCNRVRLHRQNEHSQQTRPQSRVDENSIHAFYILHQPCGNMAAEKYVTLHTVNVTSYATNKNPEEVMFANNQGLVPTWLPPSRHAQLSIYRECTAQNEVFVETCVQLLHETFRLST